MTRKHNKSRKSSSLVIKGPLGAFSQSSSEKTAYKGAIMLPGAAGQDKPVAMNLFFQRSISSDAVGIISQIFNNDPSFYQDWSNIAAVYDEYRYLGIELEFFPNNRYSKTTTVCKPGVGVIDRDDTTALGSLALGFQYESCRVLSLEDPWSSRSEYRSGAPSIRLLMDGPREAQWITTASPVATGCIKIRFEGLSSSTEYGLCLVRGLFQFRGRD